MSVSFDGITLGILLFRWSGLLVALGAALGALLVLSEAHRRRADLEIVSSLFLPTIVFSVAGARLWHIFTPPLSSLQLGLSAAHYLRHPLDALALWVGGYGIPGAWLGGVLALLWVSRQTKTSFWELADWLAPGAALAQAVGRWGDYFSHQLYGSPSNAAWRVFIPLEYRLQGFESAEYYHPLFAYESILDFILLIFLLWLARRAQTPGKVFLTYLAFYSAARFALEFLRVDVSLAGGVNVNQIFFAAAFTLSAALFFGKNILRRAIPLWRE
ncbi:MAG: prolipoprotein diacylglyceryl transferase [Anaerolineales bacterium]